MNNSFQQEPSIPIRGRIEKLKLPSTIMEMERRLQIYLPPTYDEQSTRCYPVLYVHYGQRIFEPQRPGNETWQLHRLVEALFAEERIEEMIIVGIVAERATVGSDYYHYAVPFPEAALGGFTFEAFIVQELKPFIDGHYRTLPEREHTAMIGASGSAVGAYLIACHHPQVFGKIGLLSPLTYSLHEKHWLYPTPLPKYNGLLWLGMGDAEGDYTIEVNDLVNALLAAGFQPGVDFFYTLTPDAGHDDIYWADQIIHPLLLFWGRHSVTPAERIGRAIAVELSGSDQIGVQGKPLGVNPWVQHETGFCMTALTGEYNMAQPQILAHQPYNRLYGLATGESAVTFTFGGVSATRTYYVKPTLSDTVCLHLRAHTPPETPDTEQIWFGMYALTRVSTNRYEGHFVFPRNFALCSLFSWGMRKFEQKADGSPAPYRLLRATEDATIDYTIERWGGLDA